MGSARMPAKTVTDKFGCYRQWKSMDWNPSNNDKYLYLLTSPFNINALFIIKTNIVKQTSVETQNCVRQSGSLSFNCWKHFILYEYNLWFFTTWGWTQLFKTPESWTILFTDYLLAIRTWTSIYVLFS